MKQFAPFAGFAVLLTSLLAMSGSSGQTLESYAGALTRPPLEDQFGFGFNSPRWLRPGNPYDGWGDEYLPPRPRRPHGPGFAPDLIVYNCLGERRPLEAAVATLRPFGTLKLIGAGPGCALVVPLHLDKPLRISGEKDAILMGPAAGPCMIVAPGVSVAVAEVRLRSWSDGGDACVVAENADVSLERMAVETRGTAIVARGGRLSIRDVRLIGGPSPVLRLEHSEFGLVRAHVETVGDGALILPPPGGIAQIDHAEFVAHGRRGVGVSLRAGESPPGARVVLDEVKLDGFVSGIVAGPGSRAVATHVNVIHADEVGVEINGSGMDLSNSVIDAGAVGVRLTGYVPGAPGDAPRILDNQIAARGIAGIYVTDGTPGEARNNSIGVPPGRCIVGFSRSGDFRERANLCHPF